ncbi:MAG: hypothetical protein J4N96_00605 [Chloroflexi bacterium]|nr:hypothetical protein [Chloroflexota bacterium]
MLGSAIPKRWVVSLALVGLVSLFVASYGAAWAGPASADTTTGGGTPTPGPAGANLSDLSAPSFLNLQIGQAIGISVSPIDDNGNINLGLSAITYDWSSGICGTISDTTSRTPTFTAVGSACSGTITVHAHQGAGAANVPAGGRSISVNVASPPATAVPTAVPVDPVVIPVIVPSGLSADDVAVILPSTGGTFSVPQAAGDVGPPISIEIPGGAIASGTSAAVTINVVSAGSVAPPPTGATEGATSGTFRFGSTIVEVQWYDDNGAALDTFRLNRPAEICMPFTRADIDGADGGPDGLAVWRYNGTEWIQLNSTVNVSDGTVCARTLDFSFFALGLAVISPDAAGAGLPATGDYTPGVGALILAMLAGIALVATGAFTARRARRVRVTSQNINSV